MAHIALYRKWRPRTFDDVVDQQHIVQTLKHSVATGNVAHAYLFCGTRGTGKTSLAKIFANAINCLNPVDGNPCGECEICRSFQQGDLMDIQEIDAASNNSVDNIRRITEEAVFLPAKTNYKVYIIDEVHMLSTGAFNALLKTLEEPPAHVIFILATTEVHRLPATITSRCQRFDFRRITNEYMIARLQEIADAEGIAIEADALAEITDQADGALRDAVSLLDQCDGAIQGTITADGVRKLVGVVDRSFIGELAAALADRSIPNLLEAIATVSREGKDILRFTESLTGYYRDLMIVKAADREALDLIRLTEEEYNFMAGLAARYEQPDIVHIIRRLSQLMTDLKWAGNPRTLLEINLIGLSGSRTGAVVEKAGQKADSSAGQKNPAQPAATSRNQTEQEARTPQFDPTGGESKPETPTAYEPETKEPEAKGSDRPTPAARPNSPPETHDQEAASPSAESKSPRGTDRGQALSSVQAEVAEQGASADRPGPEARAADFHPKQQAEQPGLNPEAKPPTGEGRAESTAPTPTQVSQPPAASTAEDVTEGSVLPAEETTAKAEPLVTADEPVTAGSPLWQKTLANLQVSDAFIYCFVISAQVGGNGSAVELNFPETGKQNYSILTEQRGYRPLKEALRKANNGVPLDLKISLAGTADPGPDQIVPDTDWLVTLQEKARELGIPVNRKE